MEVSKYYDAVRNCKNSKGFSEAYVHEQGGGGGEGAGRGGYDPVEDIKEHYQTDGCILPKWQSVVSTASTDVGLAVALTTSAQLCRRLPRTARNATVSSWAGDSQGHVGTDGRRGCQETDTGWGRLQVESWAPIWLPRWHFALESPQHLLDRKAVGRWKSPCAKRCTAPSIKTGYPSNTNCCWAYYKYI